MGLRNFWGIQGIGPFVALVGMAGCDSQPDQDELQALLHDEDLTRIIGTASAEKAGDGGGEGFSGFPFGTWSFDDCNAARTNLFDSSFSNNTAFRSVGVTCAPGIAGQAVSLAIKEDIVYVPDQPDFTFESGLTVAGWFNPTSLTQTRTLIRKRDKGTSSFALVLNNGKFQFVVNLGNKAISVTSPKKATPGVFQHVAATYDGNTLRLYVDGFEVKGLGATGVIPPGPGPLLIGNDGSERRFDGLIDTVHFEGRALSNAEVLALTCLRQSPTLEVTPQVSDPTPPGVSASFDIAVTNHDGGNCAPLTFQFAQTNFTNGITIDPPAFQTITNPPVTSGQTTHFTLTATADTSVEPQTVFLGFQVNTTDFSFFTFGAVGLSVAEPLGCHVSTPRELMIKNVSVVDDPIRTTGDGVWTFKHLMESMAPTPEDAPAMVEAMLQTFTTTQTINGFDVGLRPNVNAFILSSWPRTSDGALDLAQAPVRLQAIVNRFDLRNLANGDAGEARFVFNFITLSGFGLQATMILEYKLPATSDADVLGWAQGFHALGALPFGEGYNAALEDITERFAGRGARPGHVNDSALSVVRTNELDGGDNGLWQLREFALSPGTGRLAPVPLSLTPDLGFNNTDTLASFINANEASIIADTHVVPDQLLGQNFRAGAVFNDGFSSWSAPGINNNEARHHFALNTCNGCHSRESGTSFLQIFPRFPGSESGLSGFLTGTTVFDPQSGQQRTFNDLGRRKADLEAVVCGGGGAGVSLRRGISRVH